MSLVIVEENKRWLDQQYSPLSYEDMQEIIEHREVFIKFLANKEQSYRVELMKDKEKRALYKGRTITEDELLRSADCCIEVAEAIASAHTVLHEYKKMLAAEEEKNSKK